MKLNEIYMFKYCIAAAFFPLKVFVNVCIKSKCIYMYVIVERPDDDEAGTPTNCDQPWMGYLLNLTLPWVSEFKCKHVKNNRKRQR